MRIPSAPRPAMLLLVIASLWIAAVHVQQTQALMVLLPAALTHAQETTHNEADHDDQVVDMLRLISSQIQVHVDDAVAALKEHCGRTPTCRPGWAQINNNCYFIPPVERTWQGAADYCRTQYPGAELAVMEYLDEFYELKKTYYEAYQSTSTYQLFVGAKQRGNEFYWYKCNAVGDCTYELVQEQFWKPGEPNNEHGVENYGAFFWNDGNALLNNTPDRLRNFLCKYKLF